MIHHSYHYDKDKRFRILKNNIQICGECLFFSITILILSAVFSLIFPSFTPVFRNDVSSITLYERERNVVYCGRDSIKDWIRKLDSESPVG